MTDGSRLTFSGGELRKLLEERIADHQRRVGHWTHERLRTPEDETASDLEFGELLPSKPGWLEQDEYEERTGVRFMLERVTKAVDRLATAAQHTLWNRDAEEATTVAPAIIEEPTNTGTTRVDTDADRQ